MLLMYILTFPAFTAHLEKGRGVLAPPKWLLLLRKATATPFVWSFSVHVSSFASFQNIFLAFSRPSRITCAAVPAVTKGHRRSAILYLLVTDEKYVLSAHAPYHYGDCHPFPMNLLQGALHFLTVSKKSLEIYLVSKMKWKHCACLPNVYSKSPNRLLDKCGFQRRALKLRNERLKGCWLFIWFKKLPSFWNLFSGDNHVLLFFSLFCFLQVYIWNTKKIQTLLCIFSHFVCVPVKKFFAFWSHLIHNYET